MYRGPFQISGSDQVKGLDLECDRFSSEDGDVDPPLEVSGLVRPQNDLRQQDPGPVEVNLIILTQLIGMPESLIRAFYRKAFV